MNRPRGKVLGADQRAEQRGREENADPAQVRPGIRGKMVGAAGLRWGLRGGKEGASPPGSGPHSPAARSWGSAPARGPVVRVRTAERARRRELPAGPAPVSRPIRRFVLARAAGGPRRPRRGPRGRADSPRPSPGAASPRVGAAGDPSSLDGFVQAGRSRRRSGGRRPCPAEPPPPPEAHAGRGQAEKLSASETHTMSNILLLPKNSQRNAP